MITIDEEKDDALIRSWTEEARKVENMDQFKQLYEKLTGEYQHDYGSSIKATGALMIAAFELMERSSSGGFTGFQVSFLPWMMIDEFMSLGKCGQRILDFEKILYPQYDHNFEKVISERVHEQLIEKAKSNLENTTNCADEVRKRWELIASGELPEGWRVSED